MTADNKPTDQAEFERLRTIEQAAREHVSAYVDDGGRAAVFRTFKGLLAALDVE